MDVQRKKGILEVCVLAVLKKGPSYGYMIIREMEQCVEISESTLYPILKRLEQNGSLTTYRQEYNGRMRKYYQITEEGQTKIDQFLDEWDELQSMYSFVKEQNGLEGAQEAEAEEIEETAAPEAAEEKAEKPGAAGREAAEMAGAASGESGAATAEEAAEKEAAEGSAASEGEETGAKLPAAEDGGTEPEKLGGEAMTEEESGR